MIEEEIFGYLNTGQKVVGAVCNRDERGWAATLYETSMKVCGMDSIIIFI